MSTRNTQTATSAFTLPKWLPFVLFAIATLFFFRAHIFGSAFFWDDFSEYVYPVRAFAAKHMSQGDIPYWNPYSFCGMPFQADVQSALFYPPHLVLDMISGSGSYPIQNLQLLIILHFFIAQCSMYLLCRRLDVSMGGAMIAALSYGFSAPLVLHAFHPMQVEHLAWFPLIASFLIAAVRNRSMLHSVIAGMLLGMTMLSGSPQMTLYMAFSLGIVALWFSVSAIVQKSSTTTQGLSSFALGAFSLIIGFGIFCVQYLPVKEIAALSERAEISYEKASVGSLEYKQLYCTTVPKAFGSMSPEASNKAPFFLHDREYYLYWDTAFYFGVIAFMLGLFGALQRWRSSEGALFLGLAVFGFLFALGSNGFVFPIFFELPFFNALRIPARMMFLVAFSFCVLAGFGFDALTQRVKGNTDLYKLVGAASLPALFALFVATGSGIQVPSEAMESIIHGYGTTALLFVIATFVLMFLMHRGILSAKIAVWVFALLVFADLSMAHGDFNTSKLNPAKDAAEMFSPALREQLMPQKPNNIFRVSMRAPGVMALKRNQGMIDGVMLYEGYNQLLLAKRHPQVGDLKRMLDMLGVKYEIGIDTLRRSAAFRQRPDYFPNAWMVYQHKDATPETIKNVMKDTSIDYRSVAVLESPLSAQLCNKVSSEVPHSIVCDEYADNHSHYTANTNESALVCFSEIWYPAWKVYVDGAPAECVQLDYCFRGVVIPAGKHSIEWRYESQSFRQGLMITLGTLVLCVGMFVVVLMRDRGTRTEGGFTS